MKGWKRLRGMTVVKIIAFLLAVVLAGSACAGGAGALYLYVKYGGSAGETDYGNIWDSMMNQRETLWQYLFLTRYRDALTLRGSEEYESLAEQFDRNATNLRFRVCDATGIELYGNGTAEFWADDTRRADSWTEDFTAYQLGYNRELSFYLNLDLVQDWVRELGTAEDWASTPQASAYYYSVEELNPYGIGYLESTEEENMTDGVDTVTEEDLPIGAAEQYYYYVYQGSNETYYLEMTVDQTFPVQDNFYEIQQGYQQGRESYFQWFAPLLALGIGTAVGFLLLLAWLAWSAGWDREGNLALRGINRLPADLAFVLAGMAGLAVLQVLLWGGSIVSVKGCMMLAGCLGVCASVVVLPLWYLLSAQIKTKTLISNSLCGRLWRRLRGGWKRFCQWVGSMVREWPFYWKVVVACMGYSMIQAFWSREIVQDRFWSDGLNFVTWIVESIPLVPIILFLCKWAVDFSRVREGAKKIAQGDLEHRIDDTHMLPELKEHAQELSQISAGLSKAVEERVKSQRFKTELITNVSHDLKTPLTSIINYVDLLKKLDIQDETAREYLEVLDRKSQRLKTLTEDLVEASKAASGTIGVHLERLDLPQLVQQAVGEYEERLTQANLTPVISAPKMPCLVQADGRHLWRVLDNLLGNCTKYAMPGTRVYLDVTEGKNQYTVTVKNISADPLNVPAEELMKRFVRGDSARSTEGSGLGLSIARNLTYAQKGTFDLVVDGDLFKVMVTLPKAEPEGSPAPTGAEPPSETPTVPGEGTTAPAAPGVLPDAESKPASLEEPEGAAESEGKP